MFIRLMGETGLYGGGRNWFSEAVALLPAFGGSRRCVNTGNARRRHSEPGQHGSVIANVFPKTFPYQKPALLPDSLRGSEPTRIFGKPSLWSAGLPQRAREDGAWGTERLGR